MQDHHNSAKIVNRSFKSVTNIMCLRTTATKQSCFHKQIVIKINLGSACYLSFQNLLFSCLLSENSKMNIYETVILPVVLCGYETCSLAVTET